MSSSLLPKLNHDIDPISISHTHIHNLRIYLLHVLMWQLQRNNCQISQFRGNNDEAIVNYGNAIPSCPHYGA